MRGRGKAEMKKGGLRNKPKRKHEKMNKKLEKKRGNEKEIG